MEPALVISIVSICGFAAALTYNVYEFRKVGMRLDEMRKTMSGMSKEHERMIQSLDRINESLLTLAKSLGPKGRKTK